MSKKIRGRGRRSSLEWLDKKNNLATIAHRMFWSLRATGVCLFLVCLGRRSCSNPQADRFPFGNLACRSPKLCEAANRARTTMLRASLHAIPFKHILNFGKGQDPNGNAFRNCWTIHKLVGCFVTLQCRMRRRIVADGVGTPRPEQTVVDKCRSSVCEWTHSTSTGRFMARTRI